MHPRRRGLRVSEWQRSRYRRARDDAPERRDPELITGVGAQVRLQTLLAREHPVAEFALDVARRRAALHHEIR